MPDYIPDPNDSKKVVPGTKADNWFDRGGTPTRCIVTKKPTYVLVNKTLNHTVGFYFKSSASFAAKSVSTGEGVRAGAIPDGTAGDIPSGSLTGSQHYLPVAVAATAGTTLHVSTNAYSSSIADIGKITFVYRGGLDGMGRP